MPTVAIQPRAISSDAQGEGVESELRRASLAFCSVAGFGHCGAEGVVTLVITLITRGVVAATARPY
jgi:hypothetical protein